MFHVLCISREYKIYKKTNQYTWIYELDFITWQSLTCFGYSCDHPPGVFVFLFSTPWQRPQEWRKHLGDCYV